MVFDRLGSFVLRNKKKAKQPPRHVKHAGKDYVRGVYKTQEPTSKDDQAPKLK